jgi:hypothetical protein
MLTSACCRTGAGKARCFVLDLEQHESFRSLLKLPFVQRADHFMTACLAWVFVVSAAARPLVPGSRGLGQQFHALCARSFGIRIRLKAAQLNTNNQSTFASPRSFTFFRGPICFNHPNGFSTSQRLLKLIA